MDPQNISSITKVNKCRHLIIVAGNNQRNSSSLRLGEFSFDMTHGKEDEGEIIVADVTPCNKVFTGSKLLCNGEKNEDKKLEHKSNSDFSSSPIRNLGAGHIKIDVHVTYGIQSGRSWTRWKDKKIIFLMRPLLYPNKI
jgi:hypothetical protein